MTIESKRKLRAFVRSVKENGECADCGIADWRVLEFDHLGDKVDAISRMVKSSSLPKVRAELAKCELVCANCHRIRGHERLHA